MPVSPRIRKPTRPKRNVSKRESEFFPVGLSFKEEQELRRALQDSLKTAQHTSPSCSEKKESFTKPRQKSLSPRVKTPRKFSNKNQNEERVRRQTFLDSNAALTKSKFTNSLTKNLRFTQTRRGSSSSSQSSNSTSSGSTVPQTIRATRSNCKLEPRTTEKKPNSASEMKNVRPKRATQGKRMKEMEFLLPEEEKAIQRALFLSLQHRARERHSRWHKSAKGRATKRLSLAARSRHQQRSSDGGGEQSSPPGSNSIQPSADTTNMSTGSKEVTKSKPISRKPSNSRRSPLEVCRSDVPLMATEDFIHFLCFRVPPPAFHPRVANGRRPGEC